MQASRIGRERQQRFLTALAVTGSEEVAADEAGIDRARLLSLRENDQAFGIQWEQAKRSFIQKLKHEARRRAIEGVREPLVSDGKVIRDDEGRPIAVKRFSDSLLIDILKSSRSGNCNESSIPANIFPVWIGWLALSFVIAVSIWIIGDLAIRLAVLR
jgi:hypothetical protein